jgi:hypothetical protein
MLATVPIQSMARRPASNQVLGVSMLRNKRRTTNEKPPIGTPEKSVSNIGEPLKRTNGSKNFEKERQEMGHGRWGVHTIQEKAPPPRYLGRKSASNQRAQSTCYRPGDTKHTVVYESFPDSVYQWLVRRRDSKANLRLYEPYTKQIRDAYIH